MRLSLLKDRRRGDITILGQLVHNEVVRESLRKAGAKEGQLFGEQASTSEVLITAHGSSNQQKDRWAQKGHLVRHATCPLVKKAHSAQTTQPIARVRELVDLLKKHHPESEVRFRDTVCQPTKNRQRALHNLARKVDLVLVVGGENSNNSRQLAETAKALGCITRRIASAEEIDPRWLEGISRVGVTAGTSTLMGCVKKVIGKLEDLGGKSVK